MDILDQWKLYADSISSNFSINPRKLNRNDVDRTYTILRNYFGYDYFKSNTHPNISIEKLLWISGLLRSEDYVSSIYLLQLAATIDFADRALSESIRKVLKSSLSRPHDFRSKLSEIFVYRVLYYNKIQFFPTFFEGTNKKEKEGILFIDDVQYLFECRKVYRPKYKLWENKEKIFLYLYEKIARNKKELKNSLILIVDFYGSDVPKLHTLEKQLNEGFDIAVETDLSINSVVLTFENFRLRCLEYESTVEMKLRELRANHIVLIAKKSVKYDYTSDRPLMNGFYLGGFNSHSITTQEVEKYFLDIIREKRKQHSNSEFKRKILFLDIEAIKDQMHLPFSFESFMEGTVLYEKILEKVISEKTRSDLIICLLFRDYISESMKEKVIVISHIELNTVVDQLKSLKLIF